MEWPEVLRRIEGGENSHTEFKRGLGDFSSIGRTLCAFVNGDGGLLVIGAEDPGIITGTKEDPESVQERLTNMLQNGCGKPITGESGRHHTDKGWVHWVFVPRHHRGYEPFSYNGRFWIRRARSTVAPSPSELQELLNVFGLVLTEKQVTATAESSDIDLSTFHSFMRAQGKEIEKEPQPDLETDLRNASVCDRLNGTLRPTLYGLMVFGKDPQGFPHTTSLFIQCVRYGGGDQASDVLSASECRGRLDEQVHRSMGWFRSLGKKEVYRDLYRKDVPLIPEEVLREALVNAVIHRDYAIAGSQVLLEVFNDRIVVTSPGTLPNHMTVEQAQMGGAPRSRNEMMANAMVVRGLMERRGRGWLTMRHAMSNFNGTEPALVNFERDRLVRVMFQIEPDPAGPNA